MSMTLPLFPDPPDPREAERTVWSIAALTREIRALLEGEIGEVWVEGEICNLRRQASGHQYFTLKDAEAQLACVLFFNPRTRLRQVQLTDGMVIHAKGRLTVYEPRGQYQLNVQLVQPAGAGALAAKFEALKHRLAAEGLFAAERKRELPRFPMCVGIVTSPSGAAVRDMLHVLGRRAPWVHVVIHPVRVQGTGAAREIIAALEEFNEPGPGMPAVDMVVLCRGGGSMEDLWEFNDEALARAIFSSRLPVVSAVGHEIDFTIADFVADVRAPTPSAAAEIITPDAAELRKHFDAIGVQMRRAIADRMRHLRRDVEMLARAAGFEQVRYRLDVSRQRLDHAREVLDGRVLTRLASLRDKVKGFGEQVRLHRPQRVLAERKREMEGWRRRLGAAAESRLAWMRQLLERDSERLRLLGPEETLKRGYTITMNTGGDLLTNICQVNAGMKTRTLIDGGSFESTVERATPETLSKSGTRR
jgi:exodeoxyribonuclease VII large subunit